MTEKHYTYSLPMSVPDMIAENRSRNDNLHVAYNPVTGEGCCGQRLPVNSAVAGMVWLPKAMLEGEPTDVLTDELRYKKARIKYDFELLLSGKTQNSK